MRLTPGSLLGVATGGRKWKARSTRSPAEQAPIAGRRQRPARPRLRSESRRARQFEKVPRRLPFYGPRWGSRALPTELQALNGRGRSRTGDLRVSLFRLAADPSLGALAAAQGCRDSVASKHERGSPVLACHRESTRGRGCGGDLFVSTHAIMNP